MVYNLRPRKYINYYEPDIEDYEEVEENVQENRKSKFIEDLDFLIEMFNSLKIE